jgi:hypothetical protein
VSELAFGFTQISAFKSLQNSSFMFIKARYGNTKLFKPFLGPEWYLLRSFHASAYPQNAFVCERFWWHVWHAHGALT